MICFGRKIPVKFVMKVHVGDHVVAGAYCPDTEAIELSIPDIEEHGVDYMNKILLHEFFHAYCDRMKIEDSGLTNEVEDIIANGYNEALMENFGFDISDTQC